MINRNFLHPHLNADNRGLTLVELLVSAILIGIIMVGVAAFSLTVKNQQASVRNLSIITARAQSTVSFIKRDAERASGDSMNPGIWCHLGGGSVASATGCSSANNMFFLCFRYDTKASPTVSDYSDDSWHCYFQDLAANNEIYQCLVPFAPNATTFAPPGEATLSNCKNNANDRAFLMETTNANFAEIIYDAVDSQIVSIELTLEALVDSSKAYHPIKNPGVDIKSYVNPTSHSR